MSFDALRAYFRLMRLGVLDHVLGPNEQLVLIYLADLFHRDRRSFTVSYRTIALDCKLSKRTVGRIISALLRKGVGLIRTHSPIGREPAYYSIDLEKLRDGIKNAETRIQRLYPAPTLAESYKLFRAERRLLSMSLKEREKHRADAKYYAYMNRLGGVDFRLDQ